MKYVFIILLATTCASKLVAQQATLSTNKDVPSEFASYPIYEQSQVDSIPRYPYGEQAKRNFLATNIKYPTDAKANKIEGIVYAQFVVEPTGIITNIKISKSIYPSLDKETLRIIGIMPNNWKPAYKNGNAVRCKVLFPIQYKVNN